MNITNISLEVGVFMSSFITFRFCRN